MAEVSDRLLSYYPDFDQTVIDVVGQVAEWQSGFNDYSKFFEAVGVDSDVQRIQYDGYLPIDVLDVRRKVEEADKNLVFSLPLGCPIDPNMRYQLGTIAAVLPHSRVIAVANPSGPSWRSGLLNHAQRSDVASGNLRPITEPELKYLDDNRISVIQRAGASWGVDRAMAASTHGDQQVTNFVGIEVASAVKRKIVPIPGLAVSPSLILAFARSVGPMEKYARSTELPAYESARKDQIGPASFMLGLAGLTNQAIIRMLVRGDFEQRMDSALTQQAEMRTVLINGTKSEFEARGRRRVIMNNLVHRHRNRLKLLDLGGQRHTLTDNPHLQAALILQGLENIFK